MYLPKHRLLSPLLLGSFLLGGCEFLLNLSPDLLVEDNPERCADGVDNDGDGLTDCGDPGCGPFCTLCGNGVVDAGETCDDQNAAEGDGCDTNCTFSACRNGIQAPGELCFSDADASFFEVGDEPSAVLVEDLNQDGLPDLAVANEASDSLSVLLGKGNNEFLPAQSFPSGGLAPSDVVSGDFNQDGLLDLVVSNLGSDDASIFLADGESSFLPQTPFFTEDTPIALIAGDFNSDGTLDLATAKNASTFVSLLFNQGDGSFSAPTLVDVGTNPSDLVKGDFNNDSLIDIAVTHQGSDDTQILLGDGQGGFNLAGSLLGGSTPLSLVAEDFNKDGTLDLAVAYFGSDTLGIFLSDGANAAELLDIPVVDEPFSLDTGDFNRDGNPDLVVAYAKSEFVQILLGNENGSFREPETFSFGLEATPSAVKAADVNLDGLSDILVTLPGPSKVLLIPAVP